MLTERQLFLFQLLVNNYIHSAEPVGSRTMAKRGDVKYSPATIRNDFADLEDMGFLKKPHSSSGRIPSEKGYRYYVDHLLSPELLTREEMFNIKESMSDSFMEFEKLLQGTAGILSDFTNYTSIVMGPEMQETKLKHLQILSLSQDTGVLIIVTNTGHVENRTISIPKDIDEGELEKMVNILNERLSGTPLYQLKAKVQAETGEILRRHLRNYQNVLELIDDALEYKSIEQISYAGKTKILSQPEFRDVEKVLPLLNALEEKRFVHELLKTDDNGIHIKIGEENDLMPVKDCSVITASYTVGGEHMGAVAIIGPTRMAYPRVISLLDVVSKGLSNVLTGRYHSE